MPNTRLALTAFACAVFAAVASADTLTLVNGNVVEGNYLGGTAREIRMEVGDHIQTFPLDAVAGIQFRSASNQVRSSQSSSAQQNTSPPETARTQDNGPSSGQILRPDAQSSSSSSSYPNSSRPGFELPSGTQLTVRMIDSVDSETSHMGDTFRASIDEPVMVNGEAVIPRGADVVARLVDDQKSGKIQGTTVLKLVLTSVNIDGRQVEISTQDVVKESSSRGARSAKVIGGTAVVGAIIGGIAGGGKGAAIGAGSGAAVGTGAQTLGKGQRVRIPSETRLVFTLSYNVRV